uniref:Uncharacterized protein n=1 Tax=Arundo donax TaxID=35708 RepID=A0A0A9ANY1_ARUDO
MLYKLSRCIFQFKLFKNVEAYMNYSRSNQVLV